MRIFAAMLLASLSVPKGCDGVCCFVTIEQHANSVRGNSKVIGRDAPADQSEQQLLVCREIDRIPACQPTNQNILGDADRIPFRRLCRSMIAISATELPSPPPRALKGYQCETEQSLIRQPFKAHKIGPCPVQS
jgi:hypothetical protein